MSSNSMDCVAEIRLSGQVAAPDFPDWIRRHAQKLGLHLFSISLSDACLKVKVGGPDDMLQALALACGLGPQSASVDLVSINPVAPDLSID